MTAVTDDRLDVDSAAADEASWFPGWRPLAVPLLAWFASRLVSAAAIAVGNHLRRSQLVIDALHLWDGNWYLSAADGYTYPAADVAHTGQVNIAFFPLFPLLIRSVRDATGWTTLAASVLVTAVFGALAIVAIWLLVHRLAGREVADRAAMLIAFFPGTIALTLIYSEGVMLAAVAGCLLALLERRWITAGVLGALASAARPNGLAAAVACGIAAAIAILRDRDWRALLAPVLAPLGFVGYMAWLWAKTGSATIWFRVQREGWGEGIDWGRATFTEIRWWFPGLWRELDFMTIPFIVHLRLAGLVVLVIALVAMFRWRPPAIIWGYTLGVLAPCLLSQTLGARPRFLFTAFPLVVALAWWARGMWFSALLACSAILLAVTTIIYTHPGVVAP